jgi:hypothetical protein
MLTINLMKDKKITKNFCIEEFYPGIILDLNI